MRSALHSLNKSKTVQLVGMVMLVGFWDAMGILHKFLDHRTNEKRMMLNNSVTHDRSQSHLKVNTLASSQIKLSFFTRPTPI
jgi:hypothetical protein